MIDTDKYEGHTPGPWEAPHEILVSGLNHIGPLSNGQEEVNEVDAKLIADAPLLLAEVKRLRFHLKDVVDELATHLGDYENEMYDWVRKMHELYGSD